MSQISSTVNETVLRSKKFPLWIAIFGLIFVVGSLVAQDADGSKDADKSSEKTSLETNDSAVLDDDKKTDSKATSKKDKALSKDNSEEQTAKDQASVKETKDESESDDAEQESEDKVETGSYLPKGDKTAIVEVVEGEAVERLYDQIERLFRFP